MEWFDKGDLDFSRVRTVNLDEYRGLSRENLQSYYYFMHQHLFEHVNILEENTHLANGMEPDSEKECDRYAGLIRSLGGIDLQLLGIGTIMRAKKILVVANGEGKAEIVRQAFFGPVTPYVPASILQLHNDVILVADEAALSRIP